MQGLQQLLLEKHFGQNLDKFEQKFGRNLGKSDKIWANMIRFGQNQNLASPLFVCLFFSEITFTLMI